MITKLCCVELIEGNVWRLVVVVHDSIGLLDDYDRRIWATKAPEDHSAAPEGPPIANFELKAIEVAAKLLVAIWEEVDRCPCVQMHDITHIADEADLSAYSQSIASNIYREVHRP